MADPVLKQGISDLNVPAPQTDVEAASLLLPTGLHEKTTAVDSSRADMELDAPLEGKPHGDIIPSQTAGLPAEISKYSLVAIPTNQFVAAAPALDIASSLPSDGCLTGTPANDEEGGPVNNDEYLINPLSEAGLLLKVCFSEAGSRSQSLLSEAAEPCQSFVLVPTAGEVSAPLHPSAVLVAGAPYKDEGGYQSCLLESSSP
mmetsp:Transcript_7660/g.12855  ORF Transcript_7660/g.12855 Transcript_7660/m.12855 type:complete len:202 (-) Transcript_7660:384-989(-)